MSSVTGAAMGLVVSLFLAGCIPDKAPVTEYNSCFHEDGPGLPSGWRFDMLHWACDESPIGKDFAVNTSTFAFDSSATNAAWDFGATPWNGSGADLVISRASGSTAVTAKDSHNAVYYLSSASHPSQLGWLAATVCHSKVAGSVEAHDCDIRVFGRTLDVRDDPSTSANETMTSPISWSSSNSTTADGKYRLPMVFAHEIHHAVGFSHNDGIGSLTESAVGKNQVAPPSVGAEDEKALLWVYGTR